jgi:hypothetical protein
VWAYYRGGSAKERACIEAGAKISPATVSSEEETVGGDEADRWVPPVIRGREEEAVPVRESLLGCGPKAGLGRFVSPSAFVFIFLLSSFSFFYFSYFFSRFRILNPNQAKPIS